MKEIREVNRYKSRFELLHEQGKRAFIPFTLLGWPDIDTSFDIIRIMTAEGVSALELGLPFSDPMSDGPIIQRAASEALANGFRVNQGLNILKKLRDLDNKIPIGLLVYYNMLLARGVERFFRDIAEAGVDAVLIADLPPEMASEVFSVACNYKVNLIFIVSPLTTNERLSMITRFTGGFLYVVSRLGITGTEERHDEELQSMINRLKSQSDLPLVVGFGISTPEHAEKMFSYGADGVITGSRIIELVQKARNRDFRLELQSFIHSMIETTITTVANNLK